MSLNATPGCGKLGTSRISACQSGMGYSSFRTDDDASGDGGARRMPARSAPASQALDQREDVAFAVLEPRGARTAGGDDIAVDLRIGEVVALEPDAARLQVGHLAFDVVDVPERLAGFRSAGVGRG